MASAHAEEVPAWEDRRPQLGERVMVMRQPWLGYVLEGAKTMVLDPWRRHAGHVWLGCDRFIHGSAQILEAVELPLDEFKRHAHEHLWPAEKACPYYPRCWGLVLTDVKPLSLALPYWRPSSTINWSIYRRNADDVPKTTTSKPFRYIPKGGVNNKKRALENVVGVAESVSSVDGNSV